MLSLEIGLLILQDMEQQRDTSACNTLPFALSKVRK